MPLTSAGSCRAPAATHTPMVALSTAHPAKFPDAVEAAARIAPAMPPAAQPLAAKPERFDHLPADAESVKAYVRDFAEVV